MCSEAIGHQEQKRNRPTEISFWSSTEYSGFLEGLIRELNESGLDARQRFQISEASYRSAKSAPARFLLRFRQYIVYPVQLIAALTARRLKRTNSNPTSDCDFCVVSTNTFYAPLIASYLHPNVVHLVYDLFPEAMIHSGKWREGTLKVQIIRWITKQTLRRSKTNVFLGERLKNYVESIYGTVDNSAIIAVGADQSLFHEDPSKRKNLGGNKYEDPTNVLETNSQLTSISAPTILYCGNFGNLHDSETIFSLWRHYAQVPRSDLITVAPTQGLPTFKFACSGPKRTELKAAFDAMPEAIRRQIQLSGGLTQKAWLEAMATSDLALVTMVPGSERVVMPSKTYSAMMAGQAILAIAPEDSDLVDLIKAADCGWFVEPGDVSGLVSVVSEICADSQRLLKMQERSYDYAQAHFGQNTLAKKWQEALEILSSNSTA